MKHKFLCFVVTEIHQPIYMYFVMCKRLKNRLFGAARAWYIYIYDMKLMHKCLNVRDVTMLTQF